jgi:hypothetical protein
MRLESIIEKWRLRNKKENYFFELSKTSNKGFLVIHAIPPSQQSMITHYEIKINGGFPVRIFKYSDAMLTLDEGEHSVEIYAIPRCWKIIYGDKIGQQTIVRISIESKKAKEFEYIGPYWVFSKGKWRAL